jgi:DNA-directed RNA polymerase subunit RPC12/RpoP
MGWDNQSKLDSLRYVCGHCGSLVASATGYSGNSRRIYVCPHCDEVTIVMPGKTIPDALPGSSVNHLPADVLSLYDEARSCVSANCYTAAVLVSRKLLMNIGVAQGAKEGKSFLEYVDYLADKGFVPPNGRGWVDHIRKKGNEANHEIVLMSPGDAKELIAFLEMLLKFIYEFPNRIPAASTT